MKWPVRMLVLACIAQGGACACSPSLASAPAKADAPKAGKSEMPQAETVDLSQPLTLERAIQIGLRQQNSLLIAQSQLEASRARVTQARASYYPQIAPSYEYSSQLTSANVNGQRVTGTIEQSVTSIGLQQLIFDMGKREENLLASRYSAKGAEYNVLDARQTVIVNIATNYYDLLRSKELVRVAESSVARTNTELEATRAFVESGASAKKDIFQAEADYQNAQVQLIQARNSVNIAQTALKNAMGVMSLQPIKTPDEPLTQPAETPDARTVEEYLKLALDRRPDLQRDTASINSNRHQVKIAHINNGFQIQAGVNEGYRVDPNPGENRTFAVSFSYPLFDAGATRAAVREAKAGLEQSRQQMELTRQGVQRDVETSYLTREESRARIAAAQKALRAAQENYNAATEAQKDGAGTIIDVITAQSQLVTAETNAVQALYDYYTADAQLQRAIGANDPYLNGGKK